MKEDLKKTLRQTTITITISLCALAMGLTLIFITWTQEQNFSIVGAVIVAGMIFNMIPAVKRRKQVQAQMAKNPKKYR